jgi:hypothetical protein
MISVADTSNAARLTPFALASSVDAGLPELRPE